MSLTCVKDSVKFRDELEDVVVGLCCFVGGQLGLSGKASDALPGIATCFP